MSNPIEVWLRQDDGSVVSMVVNADEGTYARDITWRSLKAAQREISGQLVTSGFKPEGGWTVEAVGETWRRFHPPTGKP
jgi:hypothetical protein